MEYNYICGLLADYRGIIGEGCLAVDPERGVLEGIAKNPPPGAPTRDFRGKGYLVIPGLVDMHVHFRGLELAYKEDELSGGWAAASSGITLVVDMPNTVPPATTPEAVRAKLDALQKAPVDFGLYAGVPHSFRELEGLLGLPIAGFKVYPADLAERPGMVRRLFSLPGRLVVVHPEAPWASRGDIAEESRTREAHRGCPVETLAVVEVAAWRPRSRVHVTHASCPQTVDAARASGFTVDATPHHLFWSLIDARDPCLYKVNPPLRGVEWRMRLVQLLLEGRIDALASDHAPHALHEKTGDPLACRPGFPWIEYWPWLVFRLVKQGILKLREFLWLASRGPALILGLRGYGTLEPGARANLVVVDPKPWRRVSGPRYSKARAIPALMEQIAGEPVEVWVGGSPVYRDGEPAGRAASMNPFQRGGR